MRLVIALLLICSCRRATVDVVNGEPCPPEEAIENLHGALFLMEHDGFPTEQVRARLESARQPGRYVWINGLVRRGLDVVEKHRPTDESWRLEVEKLRDELTRSPCLTDEAHRAFHTRLDGGH